MSLIGNFAVKIGLRDRRKNGRMPTRGIEASYTAGEERKQAAIQDISPTGICLAKADELPPGTNTLVTLRRKVLDENEVGTTVSMPCRVVRAGGQKLGLEFVHEHIDAGAWSDLLLKAAEISQGKDGVRVFRTAKALAFLRRISPSIEPDFISALSGGMSNDGAEGALEIVLRAEGILRRNGQIARSGVDAKLIYRIVRRGANTDLCEAEMLAYWAGLLAAVSQEGAGDQDCLVFIDLLPKLELAHMRILAAGCERAISLGWGAGYELPERVFYSANEIRKMAGARDIIAVGGGLNRLEELGLLAKSKKVPIFEPVTEVDVTPTGLGLNLYARCHGRMGIPEVHAAGAELEPGSTEEALQGADAGDQAPAWRGLRGARPWPGMSAG
jgi:hypothetical protein